MYLPWALFVFSILTGGKRVESLAGEPNPSTLVRQCVLLFKTLCVCVLLLFPLLPTVQPPPLLSLPPPLSPRSLALSVCLSPLVQWNDGAAWHLDRPRVLLYEVQVARAWRSGSSRDASVFVRCQ